MKFHIIASVLPLAMCGGKSDNTPNPNAPAQDLSMDQLKSLCDWEAGLFGGYGQSFGCEVADGAAQGGDPGFAHLDVGPPDQATCVAGLSSAYRMCPTTLEQVQACMQWSVKNFCAATVPTQPAGCAAFFSAQCGQ
jgi:hypothetical protein